MATTANDQGLQQLMAAEAEAAAIIEAARSCTCLLTLRVCVCRRDDDDGQVVCLSLAHDTDRKAKLSSAESAAQAAIDAYRAEQQVMFEAEATSRSGETDSAQRTLDDDTKEALNAINKAHRDHGDRVVDLLLHHTTHVLMKVPQDLAYCIKATEGAAQAQLD
jgi:hypothetical protein